MMFDRCWYDGLVDPPWFQKEEALPGLFSWFSLKQIFGEPYPVDRVIAEIAAHDFGQTYSLVCLLLAMLSARGPVSAEARVETVKWLRTYQAPLNELEEKVIQSVEQAESKAIVHEQVAYALLGMIVLYSSRDASAPPAPPARLVFWLLCLNDHLPEPKGEATTPLEELVADFWWHSRFNWGSHFKRDFVRGAMLFASPPEQKTMVGADWEGLQVRAFGMSYEEFFRDYAGLLFLLSETWGRPASDPETGYRWPLVDAAIFGADGEPLREIFDGHTWTRARAERALAKALGSNGVPQRWEGFHLTPFMEVKPGTFAVASVSAMRGLIRLAPWARLRDAAKPNSQAFLNAFGLMVEGWCRRVVDEAKHEVQVLTGAKAILPPQSGHHDEIEDVVLADESRVVLFAVKSMLAEGRIAKLDCSREEIVQFLEGRLFSLKSQSYRAGVLRLLDGKVSAIRAGRFLELGAATTIVPIVVTFEHLGDNMAVYKWIEKRCREEGLLQQEGVRPVSLMTVAEFELAFSLGARGVDVLSALGRFGSDEALMTTERLLTRAGDSIEFQDLPLFEDGFRDWQEKVLGAFEERMTARGDHEQR